MASIRRNDKSSKKQKKVGKRNEIAQATRRKKSRRAVQGVTFHMLKSFTDKYFKEE